jgi:broad specificity phosphatase PhoE
MTTVYYISHPDFIIDPAVPIPHWDLSERGQQRLDVMLTQPWIKEIQKVFCSAEQKAKTTARRIAQYLDLQEIILDALGEIDRSATGFLQRAELEPVVEAFYAHPEQSIRGWERAVDAQQRVLRAIKHILDASSGSHTIAIIGHGTVGTLLLSNIKSILINRSDAPPGQGYYYAFDGETRNLIHAWKPIDLVE